MMSIKNYNNDSQCSKALKLLTEDYCARFIRDDNNSVYVTLRLNFHEETHSVEKEVFKHILNGIYYDKYGRALNRDVFNQIVEIISYKALYNSWLPEPVFNRVGFDKNGNYYYDLSNTNWEMIKISENDYRLDEYQPVCFNRYKHQIPQVEPNLRVNNMSGIDKLSKYINIKEDMLLFICWLISCFVPNIPHPILILHGEMGSAKTTALSFIKRIVDPSIIETLSMPKDVRSLSVIMQKHWFIPFDNISYISEEMSDFLCRVVTGTAIQDRKLHTNGEDYIFKFQKIVGINGINQVVNKPDLIDRSIIIELEPIQPDDRKEISQFKAEFENDLPEILGCIFKILSESIRYYKEYKPCKPQRMADFQRWGCAIGYAWKGEQGALNFLSDYVDKTISQKTDVLNYDVVSSTLISYMECRAEYSGTMTNLLSELKDEADRTGVDIRGNHFPSNARALSAKINELKGTLSLVGFAISNTRNSKERIITIKNENYKENKQQIIEDYIPKTHLSDNDCEEETEVDFD